MSKAGVDVTARLGAGLSLGLGVLLASMASAGACGAYFARSLPVTAAIADAKLFNRSTNMVVARTDATTTITMTADYRGDPKDFAVVIAVPTVLARDQIKTADGKLIDWLDRFGAPRLAETYDPDPCPSASKQLADKGLPTRGSPPPTGAMPLAPGRPSLGVTVEAQYAIGEYDIAILSAEQSDGLRIWLNEAGYNVPPAAEPVLAAYIADGLKFFVAKVNLEKKQELGYAQLQPLQISYQSPKFMVPVRLSTVNAEGPQEMFVHLLTQKGHVEAANYRTLTIPTNVEVPPFVKKDFSAFYKAVFEESVRGSGERSVFIEHVSVMHKLPARGEGMRDQDRQLAQLGVSWSGKVVLTRLHFRYDKAHFPNDLMLKETSNVMLLHGQFIIHHPYEGAASCPQAAQYREELKARQSREFQNLARLTGWSEEIIHEKLNAAR
jgi:hypothetical protein